MCQGATQNPKSRWTGTKPTSVDAITDHQGTRYKHNNIIVLHVWSSAEVKSKLCLCSNVYTVFSAYRITVYKNDIESVTSGNFICWNFNIYDLPERGTQYDLLKGNHSTWQKIHFIWKELIVSLHKHYCKTKKSHIPNFSDVRGPETYKSRGGDWKQVTSRQTPTQFKPAKGEDQRC